MRQIIGAALSVSNTQRNQDPERVAYEIRHRLRMILVDKITELAMETIIREFHTEYRVEIVVADINGYWRDVEQEAARQNMGGNYGVYPLVHDSGEKR